MYAVNGRTCCHIEMSNSDPTLTPPPLSEKYSSMLIGSKMATGQEKTLNSFPFFFISCRKLQLDDQYSQSVRLAMAMCMEALITIDPQCKWTILKLDDNNEDDDDSDPTVADKFPLLLGDNSHEIRMYMTKAVQW